MKIYEPDFDLKTHTYHTPEGIECPSVTSILKMELGSFQYGDNYYAQRGTAIHQACQYYDEGDLDEQSLDPLIKPYLESYKNFLKEIKIKILQNEMKRYHPKYLYAGTLDKIADLEGKKILIDIKTGGKHIQYKWQTAAYAEMVKDELGKVERYLLYLAPDKYIFEPQTGKNDFQEFLALFAAFQIKKNYGIIKIKEEK